MPSVDYPRTRKRRDPPADMSVHGSAHCASTGRFRCRACRLNVCWCKGHDSDVRLDQDLCDDCSLLLTAAEWRRVRAFEADQRAPWMSHTSALRLIRDRRDRIQSQNEKLEVGRG